MRWLLTKVPLRLFESLILKVPVFIRKYQAVVLGNQEVRDLNFIGRETPDRIGCLQRDFARTFRISDDQLGHMIPR